jgi:hypothetical protein
VRAFPSERQVGLNQSGHCASALASLGWFQGFCANAFGAFDVRIKHVFLTRFNVASPGREEQIRLRPGWLESRLALFTAYCLPSVAAQTITSFEWLIFFDKDTPVAFQDEVSALTRIFPFRPVYTDMVHVGNVGSMIGPLFGAEEWLLTTRLDSDDAIEVMFVERLRDALTFGGTQVYNFRHGLVYSVERQNRLYSHVDESNAFASLLEPARGAVKTIWGEWHTNLDRLGKVNQILGGAAWMQVVHGGNISNRVRGVRVPVHDFVQVFPILTLGRGYTQESAPEIFFENLIQTPVRGLFEQARAGLKWTRQAVLGR